LPTQKNTSEEFDWVESDEWLEWYRLDPVQRFKESEKLLEFYLIAGGSLDPEPDSQSPFYFETPRREVPADGRPGLQFLRRGGV